MRIGRRLALAGLLCLAAPIAAQVPPPVPTTVPKTVAVALVTSIGTITLALETERAPITAANFLRYVDAHRFDGQTIYRAVRVQPGFGLIQGGVRDDARKLFPPIALEPTARTGLSHTDGAISMARAAPDSAQSDFFIVVGNIPSMDADPAKPGDNQGFAVFGHVTGGMELVRGALDAPTSPTAGPPAMKGQMLVQPIRILSARRVPPPS